MIPGELDYGALAARLLRPDRPRRAEALTAVGGRTDPAAAWAALVGEGLIPRGWAVGDGRGFASPCNACGGGSAERVMFCESCRGRAWVVLPYPPTVSACVALAAGAEGVAWAEALARAAVHELSPWGCPTPAQLVWQVGEGAVPGPEVLGVGTIMAALASTGVVASMDAEDEGDRAARAVLGDQAFEGASRRHQLANYCYAAALWRAACATGARVHVAEGLDTDLVSPAVVSRLYAEIPDPFAPLLGVWSLGYALDDVTADALLLVAPEA